MRIIEPTKKYVPKIGDVDIYGSSQWLAPFDIKELKERKYTSLNYFNYHGWKALKTLNIRHSINCKYECPYTDKNYFSFLPYGIITDDLTKYSKYVQGYYVKMVEDSDYNKDFLFTDEKKFKSNPYIIQQCLLGPGYMYGILMSDGGNDIVTVNLEVDNGDKIMTFAWEWYNK